MHYLNNKVFNKGKSVGPIASIPKGGHIAPISTVGAIAECPNAQNIPIKNNVSETINNINPKFIPFLTSTVWSNQSSQF